MSHLHRRFRLSAWTISSALLLTVAGSAAATATTATVWFGTSGPGIYRATLDQETGALSRAVQVADVESPGFLALHPQQSLIYAVCQLPAGPSVAAWKIVDGSLEIIGGQVIGDGGATHLAVHPNGKFLVTAQYGGGSIAVFPLAADGSLQPRSQLIEHAGGSRVLEKRQESPHPHYVGFDRSGQFAFVPDLGLDKVMIYRVSDGIRLEPHGSAATPPGSGPRHMKFSTDGQRAFILNELAVSVTTFDYDGDKGTLTARSTALALTEAQKAKESFNSASEIQVHPNGRFVYTANRGHDSVSLFRAAPDGELTLIENEPIRGGWPRNFNLDPTGKWLLAAGRDSNTVAVFSIDQRSGELTYSRSIINVPASICVLFSR